MGGSFGGKDDLNYETSGQVAALAIKTGCPVRMTFSRDESMIASYKRDAMHMRVRLGMNSDGQLRACKFDGTLDSGAYSSQSPFTGWRASITPWDPIDMRPVMWILPVSIPTMAIPALLEGSAIQRSVLRLNRQLTKWQIGLKSID